LQSNPSLLSVDLFFGQGDPDKWNFQIGLANMIGRAGHVSSLDGGQSPKAFFKVNQEAYTLDGLHARSRVAFRF
jgi:hypothetical protein